jgi:hypothetical protein
VRFSISRETILKRYLIFITLILVTALTVTAQKRKGNPQNERARGGEQITEITLERTACFGTCPMYKITLRRDGTATYIGRRFVDRVGTYKGNVYGFERLAQFVESQGFFKLNNEYTVAVTDLPSTITSAVRQGQRKTIVDYGNIAPLELWAIEQAIDGIVANTKWEKISDKVSDK